MHDVRGDQRPASPRAPGAVAAPVVDIAVPVYNEEQVLAPSIERLHSYLSDGFPFSWRITIVDNGSTDGTWRCATRLARDLANVSARHLDRKGRGLALRTTWSASDATVVAYMDVDLSTDLGALLPLIAPLVSGHSDLAIGSRLAPGSSVARAPVARSSRGPTTSSCAPCSRPACATLNAASRPSGRTWPSAFCLPSRTTVGSSTRSCFCLPSTTACASTRSRSTGSTTRTVGSTSPALRSTTSAAPLGWPRPSPRAVGSSSSVLRPAGRSTTTSAAGS